MTYVETPRPAGGQLSSSTSSGSSTDRIVPFTAGDGVSCNLIHVQGTRLPDKGPVLLVHGAGVRANIFRAPTPTNFVTYLLDAGYDVWLENWRGSIDLPPHQWTLDDVALYDHPKAVETVMRETGHDAIKAVIHCQGSTSFMMSAIAGLLPNVTTIVSNAVSLHTLVPERSWLKLEWSTPPVSLLLRTIDAQWGNRSPTLLAKLLTLFVRATHHECDNTVCRYTSFIYGTGHPTLWSHENLDDATHEWVKQEFGYCPLSSMRQMARCVRQGNLVRYTDTPDLPDDFAAYPPATDARIAFFAGLDNQCFLPESQVRSYNYFNAYRPGYHSLHLIKQYGHLDMFMGHNAVRDVFPQLVAALS
jgi:pimeloyl-ACP methyl ester carboxylesterase